ncbi:Putative SMP-30/Gluconolaconase/LRE-like region [Phytophthora palmivora]|uniref:SMP-30/Gluconolaconase/LRE-like region n=1 Tax=Phytophthora palmivora TaxID=4796 RepID=A0A2P4YAM3_9STRA|nr:Putative SMP-30/Gluconolaconase/LRE-like region [Phytophthora palmivora]
MQDWCDPGDVVGHATLLEVKVKTAESEPLIIGYNGRNFSGLNDVRQDPETGDLWFTDPEYGYIQNFRAEPKLPRHIYRFEPSTGVVQVLDDGFVQLNGIEFSPDYKTLYVSDTGAQEAELDLSRPATIYAYDIVDNKTTRDSKTSACSHSQTVEFLTGILLGKIYLGETSNNFAFAPGKVFVFANTRLWVVEGINALGREVCKDFGVDSDPRCRNSTAAQS